MNGRATWVLSPEGALLWAHSTTRFSISATSLRSFRAEGHPSDAIVDGVNVWPSYKILTRDEALALFDMHRAAAALRGD